MPIGINIPGEIPYEPPTPSLPPLTAPIQPPTEGTPGTQNPPSAGPDSSSDPVEPADGATVSEPAAGSVDNPPAAGESYPDVPDSGGGNPSSTGQGNSSPTQVGGTPENARGGVESSVWIGRGEAGQENADFDVLQNFWLRAERNRDSDPAEFYGTLYGRLDLRFNGIDSILYGKCLDASDNDRLVETLMDFKEGFFQQWHQNEIATDKRQGYWYLATNADKRFHSIDGRDASHWAYNEDRDYQWIMRRGRAIIANLDYTHYCSLDANDGTFWIYDKTWNYMARKGRMIASNLAYTRYAALDGSDGTLFIFNELRQYFMKDGRIIAANSDYTKYASLDSSDGSLYIYNELLAYLMNDGRISVSTSDYTRYASISGADGSAWIFNENRQYLMKDGRIIAANLDYTHYCSLDSSNGSLWIYNDSNRVYLMKDGRLVTASSNYDKYCSLDSNDASMWLFDNINHNFKYAAGLLQLYYGSDSTNYASIKVNGEESSFWLYDALDFNLKYKQGMMQIYSPSYNTYMTLKEYSVGGGYFEIVRDNYKYATKLDVTSVECSFYIESDKVGFKFSSSTRKFQVYDQNNNSYIDLELDQLSGKTMSIREVEVCEGKTKKHMKILATATY